VRFSKRETEPDVGLLSVPVLQLLSFFSSSSVKATSAESEKGESTPHAGTIGRSLQGTLTCGSLQRLSLHFGLEPKEPRLLGSAPDGADRQRIMTVLFNR